MFFVRIGNIYIFLNSKNLYKVQINKLHPIFLYMKKDSIKKSVKKKNYSFLIGLTLKKKKIFLNRINFFAKNLDKTYLFKKAAVISHLFYQTEKEKKLSNNSYF